MSRPLVGLLTAGLVVVAAVTGCGKDDASGGLIRAEAPRLPADAAASVAGGRAALTFGADLERVMAAASGSGNRLLSPLSAQLALAMIRAGANGTTRTELDAVLHSELAGDLDASLNALSRHISELDGPVVRPDGSTGTIELSVANAVWGQTGTQFEAPFLTTLAQNYGAGMRVVDYQEDAKGARRAINGWAATETRGKIPEVVPEGMLRPDTRLVLTNAVYLKAPWDHPFDPARTIERPFTRIDGSVVPAPMMEQTLRVGYARHDGYVALQVPYVGNTLAMLLVVPDSGRFADVEAQLDATTLNATIDDLAPTDVDLGLPKFTFRSESGLNDGLAELGMRTAFSDGADFSAMTTEVSLRISAVVQQAFIEVNEKGTEAAAATAGVAAALSLPPPPVLVRIDRPFLLMIIDTQFRTPLFFGRVLDPTTRS